MTHTHAHAHAHTHTYTHTYIHTHTHTHTCVTLTEHTYLILYCMHVVRLHVHVQGTHGQLKKLSYLVTSNNGGIAKKGWRWILEVSGARRHLGLVRGEEIKKRVKEDRAGEGSFVSSNLRCRICGTVEVNGIKKHARSQEARFLFCIF